jgi:hypothetical protein
VIQRRHLSSQLEELKQQFELGAQRLQDHKVKLKSQSTAASKAQEREIDLTTQLLAANINTLQSELDNLARRNTADSAPAPDEPVPDSDISPSPVLRENSEAGEDDEEAWNKGAPSRARDIGSPTLLPTPQRLFSPSAVLYDRVATGSHCEPPSGAALIGTPSPRSYSAALSGATLNTSPPTAVVDSVRQPEGGFQTPTRYTVETRSLSAHRVVTSVPSGSTQATDNAALGEPNVPTPMFLKNNPTDPASCAFGSCNDAAAQVVNTAGSRAEFFRHVCDTLPPTASIPLPFSAQDILDLHPTVILGTGVSSDH